MPDPGRVVIVNGASSVGKSAIVRKFVDSRAAAGDCWIAVGIDDFIAKLPWQWFDIPKRRGPFGRDGLRFEGSAERMVPTVGDLGARLFAVYRRVVATWARGGFDVVVDEVTFDREAAADWNEALEGLSVTWIGIRCDPDQAAARERARGDRVIGLAHGLSAVVHEHVVYDLELDTTRATPEELVRDLTAFLMAL
jgi:chloramphenicol 3-O phosphotransferase